MHLFWSKINFSELSKDPYGATLWNAPKNAKDDFAMWITWCDGIGICIIEGTQFRKNHKKDN